MKTPILASLLSAFVWPGAGQIFNREFKKGIILILLTVLFGLSFVLGAGSEIMKLLPADTTTLDRAQMQTLSETLVQQNRSFFMWFQFLVIATWLYSVVDAWLGARDLLKAKQNIFPPSSDDSSNA